MLREALVVMATVALAACGGTVRAGDEVNVRVALTNQDFVLANGLRVVLHPEPTANVALVRVRYHVGSKDDPAGRSGLAHMFEHLMFLETARIAPGDFMQRLEAVGGVETNADTTQDRTDYHETVPPSQLGFALWLEAARMAYPVEGLDDAAFSREREVVKNEWRQHYDDVAYGNASAFTRHALYAADHPYARTTIGNGDDLDRVTLAEVRAFAERYYRPNNATLVICGAFDAAKTRTVVESLFAPIPAGPAPVRRTFAPTKITRDVQAEARANVAAPMVVVAWPAPAPASDGFEEVVLAANVLDGWLHERLVVKSKIAERVDVDVEPGHLGSRFVTEIRLKKGAAAKEAIDVIDDEVSRLALLGDTLQWTKFGDFKARQMVRAIARLEDLDARSTRILFDLEYWNRADGAQEALRRTQAVRLADVGSAADHFLKGRPHATIVFQPDPSAPRSGVMR